MAFEKIGKINLENRIGVDILEDLSNMLPLFKPEITKDSIYKKKELNNIFIAFSDSKTLKDIKLRRRFLEFQEVNKLNNFFIKLNREIPKLYEKKIDEIVKQGWNNIEFCTCFIEHFELPNNFLPSERNSYLNQEICFAPIIPFKTLKDYQSKVFFESEKIIHNKNTRFIIEMPTGSGKTRTSMEIISSLLKTEQAGTIITWLANSEELCLQAIDSFTEVWNHVGNKNVELIRVWGKNNLIIPEDNESGFVVASFQKLISILKTDSTAIKEISKRNFLVVVDEAHISAAPKYLALIKEILGKHTRLIGLTATPFRSFYNVEANKALADIYFNKIIKIVPEENLRVLEYLKKRQILSRVKSIPLQTSPNFRPTPDEMKIIETNNRFPEGLLKKIGDDSVRNIEIVTKLIELLKTHKSVLFFACSVSHSKFISSLLHYLGYASCHIDGKTEKASRRYFINEFKEGNIQVICNFGVLTTGFDAPKIDLVFMARPTMSPVLLRQMIGRGLRGKYIGGTETCTIVSVKDNIEGIDNPNVFDIADEYFD